MQKTARRPDVKKAKAIGSGFDMEYMRLNAKQKEAVDNIEGPVMVIAGPGTGKTTVLTLRIANILRLTDTPAHGILAITYTDAGVRAMREKLYGIIGDRAHDVRIHTFHGFAASIMAEYPDHFLHLQGLKQMSDIEQESLIRSIISEPEFASIRPPGKPDAYIPGILRAIDDAKREALTPQMVKEHAIREADRLKNDAESISTRGATKGELKAEVKEQIVKCERSVLFSRVYEMYDDRKRKDRKMDFNDLIIELLVALRRDELLLRLIQERFLYVHIDEHQDTNDAQNFIIAHIAEFFETPNIFIVGDEKQAIFRFQGASVDNFLLLRRRYPLMKVISLDTNYRSHQGILDAGFGMIEKNYEAGEHEDLRVKLVSKSPHVSRQVDVMEASNIHAADAFLVREIADIVRREPDSTVAVITRRNRELDKIIGLLESNSIAVSSERSIDIFNHPVGSAFFDLIEAVTRREDIGAMARTVAAGLWGITFDESIKVISDMRSGRKGAEPLERRLPGLADISAKLNDDDPLGFVIHAADKSGLRAIISKDPVYAEVWRGITALAETLVREGNIKQPKELVHNLLAYRLSAESRPVKVSVGASDAPVVAMSAHGSKGLEFDYVFMPYATEEAWVGKPHGSHFVLPKKQADSHDIRDLRRLFYVALTRARKHVWIIVPKEESDGRMLSPARFISELGEKNIRRVSVTEDVSSGEKSSQVDISSSTPQIQKGKRGGKDQKLAAHARRVMQESGLSVTALNHFIESPQIFVEQSILKLPQAPSILAEKGSAMHEAISKVWASGERDPEKISDIMTQTISSYLDTSVLGSNDKEAIRSELVKNTPLIAKALAGHFGLAQGGKPGHGVKPKIFTEHWVKSYFEGKHDGKAVRIPIHGKLDAIIDTGSELLVFDYKTRKAMSVNAIKGETKSPGRGAPGGYWRQLVFYKLLLSGDPRWRDRKITPALVFVTPDSKGRCAEVALPIGDADIAKLEREIQSVIDTVWSGEIASPAL